MMGTHARAIELLAEVNEHAPSDGDVLFNLGLCERELGNFGAAGLRFKSYTQSLPGREDGVAALASVMRRFCSAPANRKMREIWSWQPPTTGRHFRSSRATKQR